VRKEEVLAPFEALSRYFFEGLRKIRKILSQDVWCGHRDSNQVPPTYIQICHRSYQLALNIL
jgi:hypothetical protein